MTAPHEPDALRTRLLLTRRLAVAATLGLIVLGLAWELLLAPTGRGTLALKVMPLLPSLPGLWRDRLGTFRWTSLLVWLYVLEGLVRGTSEPGLGALLAWAQTAIGLVLFAACGSHVRDRLSRSRRLGA